ncbi:hypothetical protein B0H19DRAFT_1169365 [Mycena capillaripes]|nr:hypothetical protein B0H19DRAFT_1169365 [Mycena capillaripes]
MTSASWIWAPTSNGSVSTAAGNVAFLKVIPTPTGKTASGAVISMTAADSFTLFVNGQPIGASKYTAGTAVVLRAALNASVNTFSVLVTNDGNPGAPPPGLLAAIQVLYTDSPSDTFVSNSSWLAASNIPSDFPTPADLSSFELAVVIAPNGQAPWGSVSPLPADPSPLTLTDSTWIWSTVNANTVADVGSVGFRKTFVTPFGKTAQTATILLTVDNSFQLYVNNVYVGTPPQPAAGVWQYAQQFTVNLNATSNVFTVIAQNYPSDTPHSPGNAAGFIAAIKVLYQDGSSDIIRTNSSWLNSNLISLPVFLSTDDNNLSLSSEQGPMGMGPWGQLSGTSDALSAASVPVGPFNIASSTSSDPLTPSPSAGPASSASHPIPLWAIITASVGGFLLFAALMIFLRWWRPKSRVADKEATPYAGYPTPAPSTISTNVVFDSAPYVPPPQKNKLGAAPAGPGPGYGAQTHDPYAYVASGSVAADSSPVAGAVYGSPREKAHIPASTGVRALYR